MDGRSDDDGDDELEWLKWSGSEGDTDEMKQEADSRDGMMQK